MNSVNLVGRLGKPPETRTVGSTQVANFSIAVGESYKDKTTGERKDVTNWVNIVAWGKLAEICGQYLTKGSQVAISGKLQVRKYEKDGATRYSTEVVADKMQMLGPKPTAAEKPAAPAGGGGGTEPFDDSGDIPFIRAAGVRDRA